MALKTHYNQNRKPKKQKNQKNKEKTIKNFSQMMALCHKNMTQI